MKTRLLTVVLLLVTVLAACGKGEVKPAASGDPTTTTTEESTSTTEAEDAAPAEVEVTATDFAYAIAGGTTMAAGEVTITLTNDGAEEHQVTVVAFKEGKGIDDLAAVGEDPSQLDDVLDAFGGPNGVGPGATVSSTQVLEPGEYLFACFIPSPADGVPHAAKGMLAPVTVEGDAGDAAETEADLRLVLDDYDFGLDGEALIEAGTYEILNESEQLHEAVLYTAAEGSTTDDVLAFFQSPTPPPGPPPFVAAGGVAAFGPGGRVLADIEAGEYVFICFIPDAADGAPHFAKGMIQIVNVE